MNKQSKIQNLKSKIAIVGAGPAGASLAIRLAKSDFDVCLIEREKFPRHKLCGEFISPECLEHFKTLGVFEEMLAVGGERVTETVFYEPRGKSVSVPSAWLGASPEGALSLSRAEMDFRLLERAREAGVSVFQETQVTGLLFEKSAVCGVKVKSKNGETREVSADLTIDATGRANVLASLAKKSGVRSRESGVENQKSKIQNPKSKIQTRLVGFKAHLENVDLERGRCEIYFFRGGYGGLSFVENNRANHCFLIKAEVVKKYIGQTNLLIEEVIFENRRAFEAMRNARQVTEWLTVSIDGFGLKNLHPATNLFAAGDAAAFIDPFTGSGMLMALESAELLARTITGFAAVPEQIAENYEILYRQKFAGRLRLCSLMRRAALVPNLAKTVISALSLSRRAQEFLARATRQSNIWKKSKL